MYINLSVSCPFFSTPFLSSFPSLLFSPPYLVLSSLETYLFPTVKRFWLNFVVRSQNFRDILGCSTFVLTRNNVVSFWRFLVFISFYGIFVSLLPFFISSEKFLVVILTIGWRVFSFVSGLLPYYGSRLSFNKGWVRLFCFVFLDSPLNYPCRSLSL